MTELFRGDTVEYIGARPLREATRDGKTWPAVNAGDVGTVRYGQRSAYHGDLQYMVQFGRPADGMPRAVDRDSLRRVPAVKTPDATELLRQAVEHLADAFAELAQCGCPESVSTGAAEAAQYAIADARNLLAEVPR